MVAAESENEQLLSEEQRMLAIVERFRREEPTRGGTHLEKVRRAERVARAMRRLGELGSTEAIPVLVDLVDFGYTPPHDGLLTVGADGAPPLIDIAPACAALTEIGCEAAGEVVRKLGDLDEDRDFLSLRKAYMLRRLLVRIMGRERAVSLLEKSARNAANDRIHHRFVLHASKIRHLDVQ